MNSALTDRPVARDLGGRGFSMLEMLIAMAIVSIFFSGVYVTYIQVAKTNKKATARLEALRNGRSAIQSLSDELKSINDLAGKGLLISPNTSPKTFGDGIDNDGDGAIDEEVVNGLDDDSSSTTEQISLDDRHAELATGLFERPLQVGKHDLGDANVDEDVVFGQDFIIFQETPDAPSDIRLKVVTYAIPPEGYDGEKNVLVRQTRIERTDPANPSGPAIIEGGKAPIAFGVLGFDLLFWDSNVKAASQYWRTSWDSTKLTTKKFRLPASVYLRLTLQADPRPAAVLQDGKPVETITLATVIDIESVIGSPLFDRTVLP